MEHDNPRKTKTISCNATIDRKKVATPCKMNDVIRNDAAEFANQETKKESDRAEMQIVEEFSNAKGRILNTLPSPALHHHLFC